MWRTIMQKYNCKTLDVASQKKVPKFLINLLQIAGSKSDLAPWGRSATLWYIQNVFYNNRKITTQLVAWLSFTFCMNELESSTTHQGKGL